MTSASGHEQIEPLHPDVWFQQVTDLNTSIGVEPAFAGRPLVRRLYHLLVLTPAPLRLLFAPPLDEAAFEALLDQSVDAAAQSLISVQLEHALAQDEAADGWTALVRIPGQAPLPAVRHREAYAALAGALCQLIRSLFLSADQAVRPPHQGQRKPRSGQHRKSNGPGA